MIAVRVHIKSNAMTINLEPNGIRQVVDSHLPRLAL
jgi:hypothetical protein